MHVWSSTKFVIEVNASADDVRPDVAKFGQPRVVKSRLDAGASRSSTASPEHTAHLPGELLEDVAPLPHAKDQAEDHEDDAHRIDKPTKVTDTLCNRRVVNTHRN